MLPVETLPKARALERTTLWIVVGLFLALSISWAAYPRAYGHYHPAPPWSGQPESFGHSNAQLSFLLAILLAFLGFLQIGSRRWLQHDTTKFLSWMFLLLGLGLAFDFWTFALATRFWTLTVQLQSDQARRAYEMSNKIAPYFLKSIVAVAVLNMALALFPKRNSGSSPD